MARFTLTQGAVLVVAGLVAILTLSSCGPKPEAAGPTPTTPAATTGPVTLNVYIPCGIIVPMHAGLAAFSKQHPEIKIKPFYDNPVGLARRVEQAPESADIYVGPGPVEVDQLAAKKLVDKTTETPFAQLELVVLVPKANPAHIKTPADLARVSTFACPDPKYNSLGVMTQTALTKLGAWDKVKDKLVEPEYAIDAYKLVASGKAEAGVTYRTCPLDSNPEKIERSTVKIACALPLDSYDPEDCRFHAVVTTSCTHKTEAATLLKFLASDEAGAIMEPLGLPWRHAKPGAQVAAPGVKPAAATPGAKPKVSVVAFYPDTPGHADIKQMVQGFNKRYPGQVKGEFLDFNSDEGFKRMTALNISCGCILIDGKQAFDVTGPDGKPRHINFARAMGGEWQAADLDLIVKQEVARVYK